MIVLPGNTKATSQLNIKVKLFPADRFSASPRQHGGLGDGRNGSSRQGCYFSLLMSWPLWQGKHRLCSPASGQQECPSGWGEFGRFNLIPSGKHLLTSCCFRSTQNKGPVLSYEKEIFQF